MFQRILQSWAEKYEDKFSSLLEEVGFSETRQDLKLYVIKLLNLLHYLKFSISIIIDNVDQHDTVYQEKLFIFANHITSMLRTVTVVALREETFVVSTRTGVFDAYNVPKFHIASPDFLDLIKKRIDFTLKLLSSDLIKTALPRIAQKDVSDLIKYFSIIKSSLDLTNSQSKRIVRFIDSISVGNMREALRMFNNFIISGNTNIREIFSKHDQSGNYQLSYHQFLKSIMLGEHMYYIQDRSQVINLLDFDPFLSSSHFMLLRILQYLTDRSNSKSQIGRGYVLISDLLLDGEKLSLPGEVIKESLLRLSNFNLVEFDNQSRIQLKTAAYLKITPAGRYYLERLIFEFVYLDLVLFDTPLSDFSLLKFCKTVMNETDIEIRLARTSRFVEYLRDSELREFSDYPEYAHSDLTKKRFGDLLYKKFPYIERAVMASYKRTQERRLGHQ